MTVEEAKQAILDRFVNNWTGTDVDDTHVERENQRFDGPPDPPAAWVRVIVDPRAAAQRTMSAAGNRQYDRRGALLVQIFVPRFDGSQSSDPLVQEVRSLFEGIDLDGIHFFSTQVRHVRDSTPDPAWYQVTTETEFLYHERR